MAVNEAVSAYSTTAASNTPGGTTAVGTDLDDHLRDIKKNIRLAYENAKGPTSPDIVKGRIWYDTSGSGSALAILKVGDGAQDIGLFEINESANTVYPYFGSSKAGSGGVALVTQDTLASAVAAINAADEGMAILTPANGGLSGGGTFSATRSFTLAVNQLQTLTASATAAMTLPINNGSAERAVTMKNLIGAVVASQAQMETAVSTDTVVSPLNQPYHPLHPKAVGYVDNDGTSATLVWSYGIASAVRSAAGIVKITWTTKMTVPAYPVQITTVGSGRFGNVDTAVTHLSASLKVRTADSGNVQRDNPFSITAWGDQ